MTKCYERKLEEENERLEKLVDELDMRLEIQVDLCRFHSQREDDLRAKTMELEREIEELKHKHSDEMCELILSYGVDRND